MSQVKAEAKLESKEVGRCERIGYTKRELLGEILDIVSRLIKREFEAFGVKVWVEHHVQGQNGVIMVMILDEGEDKDGEK